MKAVFWGLCVFWGFGVFGAITCGATGMLPEEVREDFSKKALKSFWGHAVDSKGDLIEPDSELDRETVPIDKDTLNKAYDRGEVSGMAEWCRLDWKPNLFHLTNQARADGRTDKQVAFITLIHGLAQQVVFKSLSDGKTPCGDKDQHFILGLLSGPIPAGTDTKP